MKTYHGGASNRASFFFFLPFFLSPATGFRGGGMANPSLMVGASERTHRLLQNIVRPTQPQRGWM